MRGDRDNLRDRDTAPSESDCVADAIHQLDGFESSVRAELES